MHNYYPVFLNLHGKRCVIIGGGAIAEGKLRRLYESGADITLISPEATPAIRQRAAEGLLRWQPREYQPGDLDGAFLAIAATDCRPVNQRIFEEAEQRGVLLNVVDDPPRCSFIAPSIVERGQVTLAISTGGASPALARKLREALTAAPDLEWADLAGVMAGVRARLRERGIAIDPQRWQCCLQPELLELARTGQESAAAESLLSALLGQPNDGRCPAPAQCHPNGCQLRPTPTQTAP